MQRCWPSTTPKNTTAGDAGDLSQMDRGADLIEGERFGWHRFRHSLSTWANETTKDITVSQTMRRHAKPDTTAIYTHGNFSKALDAQRVYMEQMRRMKPASEATQ